MVSEVTEHYPIFFILIRALISGEGGGFVPGPVRAEAAGRGSPEGEGPAQGRRQKKLKIFYAYVR